MKWVGREEREMVPEESEELEGKSSDQISLRGGVADVACERALAEEGRPQRRGSAPGVS